METLTTKKPYGKAYVSAAKRDLQSKSASASEAIKTVRSGADLRRGGAWFTHVNERPHNAEDAPLLPVLTRHFLFGREHQFRQSDVWLLRLHLARRYVRRG